MTAAWLTLNLAMVRGLDELKDLEVGDRVNIDIERFGIAGDYAIEDIDGDIVRLREVPA